MVKDFGKISHRYFATILRVFLGFVLVFAAVLKVSDMRAFVGVVGTYGIVGYEYVTIFAVAIVVIELLTGFSLALSVQQRLGLIAAMIVFLLLDTFTVYSVVFNKGWVCNCFGSLFESKISYTTIARNSVLLASSIYVFVKQESSFPFDGFPTFVRTGVFAVLILGFAIVLVESKARSHDTTKRNAIALGTTLPPLGLISLEGDSVRLHFRREPYAMLVFFTLEDCSSCLLESGFWEQVHQQFREKVKVVGIAQARSSHFLREWVRVRGLHFPVVFDGDKSFVNRFAEETPLKIVVDRSNEVVLIDKSTDNEKYQQLFLEQLSQISAR